MYYNKNEGHYSIGYENSGHFNTLESLKNDCEVLEVEYESKEYYEIKKDLTE